MTLSIITICFNDRNGLEKTIESVQVQTYRNFEHIIIDGGSNDGSEILIENNKAKFSFAVSEKDNGRYHAMNKGIMRANGKYSLFLNSGDFLANDRVLENIFTSTFNEEDILYGDLYFEKSGELNLYRQPSKIGLNYLMSATMAHPSTFIKTYLFHKHGCYNETFVIASDYELFLRLIMKHQASFHYFPFAISVFNMNGISNNSAFDNLQLEEREKAQRLNIHPFVLEYYQNSELRDKKLDFLDCFETQIARKVKDFPFISGIQRAIFKIVARLIKTKKCLWQ